MKLIKISEYGFTEAMLGLSLSFNSNPDEMPARAEKLFNKEGGHNKFLESMTVYLDITTDFKTWKQFDTYRAGITKQSESTMHTILKNKLTQENFSSPVPKIHLAFLNSLIFMKNFDWLVDLLPCNFLQRRIICTNYKTLRNIYQQRNRHKLQEWKKFCSELENQLDKPEFLK